MKAIDFFSEVGQSCYSGTLEGPHLEEAIVEFMEPYLWYNSPFDHVIEQMNRDNGIVGELRFDDD